MQTSGQKARAVIPPPERQVRCSNDRVRLRRVEARVTMGTPSVPSPRSEIGHTQKHPHRGAWIFVCFAMGFALASHAGREPDADDDGIAIGRGYARSTELIRSATPTTSGNTT